MTERQHVKAIAERWRKQYTYRGKWKTYEFWQTQPEQCYRVLIELKTIDAVESLLGQSWTNYARRMLKRKKKAKK